MAQKIAIFLLLFVLAIFQISVLPNIFGENSVPNILLVMLIFWTARKGLEKTWKLAILGGVITDLLLFTSVGLNTLSFLIAVIAVNYLAKRFLVTQQTWRLAILIFLVAAGVLVNEIILALIANFLLIFRETAANAPIIIGWPLAYKMLNSIIIFTLLYWPFKKIETILNLYGSRTDPKSNVR